MDEIEKAGHIAQSLVTFVFSWIILLGAGVILSGKILAKHWPLNLTENDLFTINIVLFRLTAKGDQVALGLIVFALSLGGSVIFGGQPAYELFKSHSGLDIGQWNSICFIASLVSVAISTFLHFSFILLGGAAPVVTPKERSNQLKRLRHPRK